MSDERKSRWGVKLEGHSFDLEYWEADLQPPFDPAVIVHPVRDTSGTMVHILQSESFATCASASEVREVAIPLIRTLSGLIGVRQDARPVTLGSVVEFKEDGSLCYHVSVEVVGVEGRSKAGILLGTGSEGFAADPTLPRPSYVQIMLQGLSDDLKAALRYYDMADNWYDLYKAYEAVLDHLNPRNQARAKDKLKRLGFTHSELKGLDSSPQHYRHHRTSAPLVFSFREAKEVARRILDAVLQSNHSPSG